MKTCEQMFDVLSADEWVALARWLHLSLTELMKVTGPELLFVRVVRQLDHMVTRA